LWALRAHRGTFAFLRFWFQFIECRIEFLVIILRFGSGGGGGGGGGGCGGGDFNISLNSKIPPICLPAVFIFPFNITQCGILAT